MCGAKPMPPAPSAPIQPPHPQNPMAHAHIHIQHLHCTRCLNANYIRPWMKTEQEKVAHALHDAAEKAVGTIAHAHIAQSAQHGRTLS